VVHPVLDDVFLGSAAIEAGLVTRSQLTSKRFQRLHRGVYAPTALRVDHRVMCRSAVLLVPDAVVAGRSAAWLCGARSAASTRDPVHLALPAGHHARRRDGMTVRRVLLEASTDVTSRHGLKITTAARTVWDLAMVEEPNDAVPVIDEMLQRRLVSPSELEVYAAARSGRQGVARVRRALDLSDEHAESPPESRVRLALTAAGMRPRTQVDVVDSAGRFVARVDMAYEDARLAVEYDGGWHAEPGQLARDRDRLNRLQAAGWTVLFVTAPDLRNLDAVVDRVLGALTRLRTPH
jgi:very-short-patch-repair endonuclease